MPRPSWTDLETAVPFPILVPDLPPGWEVTPAARATGTIVLNVYDSQGVLRYNLGESLQPPAEDDEREVQEHGGRRSYWTTHFAERTPVTNVVAAIGAVHVTLAGKLDPDELGQIVATLHPRR